MKRIRICVLSLILAFVSLFAIGCDSSPTNTDDIFLCIEIKVKNNSDSVYSASGTDIWLLYGETKIGQVDIVKRWVDGFYNISQTAISTTTPNF